LGLAREAAQALARVPGQSQPTVYSTLVGYAAAAEVYLALWKKSLNLTIRGSQRENKQAARQACKVLRGFAHTFPIGQSRAWLYQGWFDWLSGQRGKAQRAWYKSLAAAKRYQMPYDQGLAHLYIGAHMEPGRPERQDHLNQARQLFSDLGVIFELERTMQHLSEV
jgi:hypothetical protein